MDVRHSAVFLVNPAGLIETWSLAASNLLGMEAAISGAHLSKLFTSEEVLAGTPLRILMGAAVEGSTAVEAWQVRGDHSHFWARVTVTALSGADGALSGFAVAVHDLTEDRKRERDAAARRDLLESIHTIQAEFISSHDSRKSFDSLLQRVLDLTRSEYGFIGEVIEGPNGPYLKAYAITNIAWNEETTAFYEAHAPTGMEFHNLKTLFGVAITTRSPVISNRPSTDVRRGGLPSGHPPLKTFLGAPLIQAGEMVGLLGLANRGGGYDESLLDFLQPLFSTCANLIFAYRSDRLRDEAERALHAGRLQWQEVLDNLPSAISVKDLDGRYRLVNQEFARLIGVRRESAIGRTHKELFPSKPAQWVDESDHRILDAGEPLRYETRFPTGDGEHTVLITKFPVRDNQSQITGIGAFALDIQDRIRAEEALRASEQRFRGYFETALLGMSISTADRRLLEVNDKWCEITGYSREEMVAMKWSDFTHPDDLPADLGCLRDMIEGKIDGYCREKRLIRRDGRPVHVSLQVRAIRRTDGSLDHSVALIEDLTVRRELEDQLRQSQKMEAVGVLAGGVAHDFNNLLTVVGGHSTFLMRLLPSDDERRDHVIAIAESCDRAASLTRQLLAFSRKQVLEPRTIDLNGLLAQSARMLKRLIGEDIELELELEPDLLAVKVDPAQIEQAVLNLAVNAREAMPRGGRLILATRNVEVQGDEAPGLAAGDYVMICVSDTGCGIAPEIRPRIFEPFFTTKKSGVATGLGLSTVYGIVTQSGGSVAVSSVLGEGTTFRILLPAVEGPAQGAENDVQPAQHGSEAILLVEDEDPVRALLRISLKQEGYSVLDASNGPAALALAESAGHQIQLLITDVVMPVMSGRDLAERMRAKDPSIKVLYMSGYTDDAVIRHGIAQATDAFLQKPFNLDDLSRRVRELLDT